VKTGHPGERPNQNSINLDARDVLSQEGHARRRQGRKAAMALIAP
jgi:hypothetical protein